MERRRLSRPTKIDASSPSCPHRFDRSHLTGISPFATQQGRKMIEYLVAIHRFHALRFCLPFALRLLYVERHVEYHWHRRISLACRPVGIPLDIISTRKSLCGETVTNEHVCSQLSRSQGDRLAKTFLWPACVRTRWDTPVVCCSPHGQGQEKKQKTSCARL